MHCFHGYCCANFLEAVDQWVKTWALKKLSPTRYGLVSTWMGDLRLCSSRVGYGKQNVMITLNGITRTGLIYYQ